MEGNLSSYRIFYTVAQKGNISYAAKELYISQPAISKAIGKLEESLDCKLFLRSSRGVVLTEEGKILFESVKNGFEQFEDGEEKIKRLKELDMGQIRIGVSATLCKHVLVPYLKRFVEEYPNIKVMIECQSSVHTVKQMDENRIDIGLIGRTGLEKDIQFQERGKIQDTFVATKSYLDKIDPSRIFETGNLLVLDEENVSRQYLNRYFAENGIEAKQVLEVSNMDLLIEFAKIGLGIACVIREFVEEELRTGALVEVPLTQPMERRQIGFAYKKNKPLSPAIRCFLENLPVG